MEGTAASTFRAEVIVAFIVTPSCCLVDASNLLCPSGFMRRYSLVKGPCCCPVQAGVCSGDAASADVSSRCRWVLPVRVSFAYLLEGTPWEQDLRQLLIPELCPSSRLIWCSLPPRRLSAAHIVVPPSPPHVWREVFSRQLTVCRNYNETYYWLSELNLSFALLL